MLQDATELKVLTGLDDHSRYCIAAGLLTRATSKAVCAVLVASLRRFGIPDEHHSRWAQRSIVAGFHSGPMPSTRSGSGSLPSWNI